jgi:hypothetical protein
MAYLYGKNHDTAGILQKVPQVLRVGNRTYRLRRVALFSRRGEENDGFSAITIRGKQYIDLHIHCAFFPRRCG